MSKFLEGLKRTSQRRGKFASGLGPGSASSGSAPKPKAKPSARQQTKANRAAYQRDVDAYNAGQPRYKQIGFKPVSNFSGSSVAKTSAPKATGSTSRTRKVGKVAAKVAARTGVSQSAARAKARAIVKSRR